MVHDAEGTRTGLLRDAAMSLVDKITPPMTHEHRMRALRQALEHAASLGVTSVQDMNPSYDDIAAYSETAEQGRLTVRIYAAPYETDWKDQAKIGLRRGFGGPFLRLGAVKSSSDGPPRAGTA